jgi:magnesium-protoporphyrin IX monomethyl ester (oxidative) cyclase
VGEGEEPFAAIAGGKSPASIPGVYVSPLPAGEKYPAVPFVEDLDRLPFADYGIPGMDMYFRVAPRPGMPFPAAVLTTSRGCPFDCEFCSIHPSAGYRYRFRSAAHVLEEIRLVSEKYKIRILDFEDDNFTLNRERAVAILEGIIRLNEKGAGLGWSTPNGVRIETLDAELIRLIKRSNCAELVVGLEHMDPEVLRSMNKQLDLEKAKKVIAELSRSGISRITLFLIVGYPGETRERFEHSRRLLKEIYRMRGDFTVCVNIAQPYPGTRLLERCRSEGYISDTAFDNFLVRRDLMDTEHTVSIITPDFSVWDIFYRRNLLIADSGHSSFWKAALKKMIPPQCIGFMRTVMDMAAYMMRRYLKRRARRSPEMKWTAGAV